MQTLTDAVIIGALPGLVEVAKRAGLPSRYAGVCAVVLGVALVAIEDLSRRGGDLGNLATWIAGGIVAFISASFFFYQ
jgi:hypothetical protein